MKAYEFSTKITSDGKLDLPEPLKDLPSDSKIRVIILIEETPAVAEATEDDEESEGFSATSFRRSWQQAIKGQTLPLSQMWKGINVD
jgi:hypothetical protein